MPTDNSEDLTPVQRLLRLKRHEGPGDQFVSDFMLSFKERQRAELLKQSAHALMWERLTTYWTQSGPGARLAWAGASAAALLLFAWVLFAPQKDSAQMAIEEGANTQPALTVPKKEFPVDAVMIMGLDPAEEITESPLLLSRHFSGGYPDDVRQVRAAKKAQASFMEQDAESAEQQHQ